MSDKPIRQIDFICPFKDGDFHCPEIMTPMRPRPSHRERKLFVLMNRAEKPTKNGCPRCDIFIENWKKHVGLIGHIRYFIKWVTNKEIREPRPQETM